MWKTWKAVSSMIALGSVLRAAAAQNIPRCRSDVNWKDSNENLVPEDAEKKGKKIMVRTARKGYEEVTGKQEYI